MEVRNIRCPKCGEQMQFDPASEYSVCGSCGAKIVQCKPAPPKTQADTHPQTGKPARTQADSERTAADDGAFTVSKSGGKGLKIAAVTVVLVTIALVLALQHTVLPKIREKQAQDTNAVSESIGSIGVGIRTNRNGLLASGGLQTIGLRADGTAVLTQAFAEDAQDEVGFTPGDVSDWTELTAVDAGDYHLVGLRVDGTVVAAIMTDTGSEQIDVGQCDVSDWADIVAVSAGMMHTVGLQSDGTVAATSISDSTWDFGQCGVSDWTDMIAVCAADTHTVGVRSDGTVAAAGSDAYGQCGVSDWTDITAVAAGFAHTVGLRADGTVVASEFTGDPDEYFGQCDVSDWTDIIAIAAGDQYTVGLRSDGTVVAVGQNDHGQCDVGGWTNIVAVAAGGATTVGLRTDGTVAAAGWNNAGQCGVSDWTNMRFPS